MKIIDMHCDTLSAMLNRKRQGQTYGLDQHHTQISLDWMQQSGYLLQNFAVFVNLEETQTCACSKSLSELLTYLDSSWSLT